MQYDLDRFINDFHNTVMTHAILFLLQQKEVYYPEYVDAVTQLKIASGTKKKCDNKPTKIRGRVIRGIKFLHKIKFLTITDKVRLNDDFIPINQK